MAAPYAAGRFAFQIFELTVCAAVTAFLTLPYDLRQDLAPIALLPSNPQLIVSKNAIPAKDLSELVAWIKLHQATVSAGTGGAGTAAHVSGVYFENITGTHFKFVPYRGSGPAMQDLIAGHIDFMFDQFAEALPQMLAGLIKAYAVTTKARLAAAPDIPTVDEAGLPRFLRLRLAFALGAKGDTEGDYREAQRGRSCRDGWP
jgi:tripartite-type tricarboxylate transporter receptor subunit TctC